MIIENLRIHRAIVHQFGDIGDSLTSVDQSLSSMPQSLDEELRSELEIKIVQLLSSSSWSHEMVIVESGPNSAYSLLDSLFNLDDQVFTETSKAFARNLHQSHPGSALANSVLVVINGSYGSQNAPIAIIVKADKHQALTHSQEGRLSLIRDLFLGGSQRLNKIAAFGRTETQSPGAPDDWEISLFDGQTKGGADYFKVRFLGLGSAPTGARFTELLSKGTNNYLEQSDLPPEEKARIARGIHTEIWDSAQSSLDVESVAERYLPAEHQDEYINHLHCAGMPAVNFERDTSRLSRAKAYDLKFSNGVQLRLPWGGIDENLTITETEEGDGVWTTIRFRGKRT